MQSSDGTQPWCPGQSMWCLIAEHITGSELPKIHAALGSSLVDQYRDIHAEVSHFPCLQKMMFCLWVSSSLWKKLQCCMLYLLVHHTEAAGKVWECCSSQNEIKSRITCLRSDQNYAHSEAFQLKLFMSCDDGGAFVSGLLWLPALDNYNSPHSIINVECGSNGSAKSTNQTSILTQDLYSVGLQTSHNEIKILNPEVEVDGEKLWNESV